MKSSRKKQKSPWLPVAVFFAVLIAAAVFGSYALFARSSPPSAAAVSLDAQGVQVAMMAIRGLTYEPSTIVVHAGQKVRWVIDATNAQGCARTMYSRQLGINQALQTGQNIIEFTPTKTGIIPFSCTMGMARGQFQVV